VVIEHPRFRPLPLPASEPSPVPVLVRIDRD